MAEHTPTPRPMDPVMDPVTLAVLRGRLEQIADEMDATPVSYTHLTLPTTPYV